MTGMPWPRGEQQDVLFLLDAAHRVEEELLRNWLREEQANADFTGTVRDVVVPIARSPENIPTLALGRALDLPATTLIIPVRVAWMSSVDEKSVTPRLRDLIVGNPRKPGLSRARRILRSHPEKVQCIAAESATLAELQDRYSRTRGETADVAQLSDFVAGQAGLALDIAERRLRGGRYKVPDR